MSAERMLVTGATDFTGSHLCQPPAKESYAVGALLRDPNRSAELSRWGGEIVTGEL